jgi:hypothetical protein
LTLSAVLFMIRFIMCEVYKGIEKAGC